MSASHRIAAFVAGTSLLVLDTAAACTSLPYQDAAHRVYVGRTLELAQELPYLLAYYPTGQTFHSQVGPRRTSRYASRHPVLGVALPVRRPTAEKPLDADDLKLLEGFNDQGLDYSVLAYPSTDGPARQMALTQRTLSAVDLGTWALGQFETVAQVKEALARQPFEMVPLAAAGGKEPPIHFIFHDRSGAAIVVEFRNGRQQVFDNPVGVMTNGPDFQWHLTNLDNYTHLGNMDTPTNRFGALEVKQPDSGIATAALPASNTSVGRFVRAAYYSKYAERVEDPDQAVLALAHIMNNFDRPRGITADRNTGGSESLDLSAFGSKGNSDVTTEYTSWTTLTDLDRGRLYIRTYNGLGYARFDLPTLASRTTLAYVPLGMTGSLGMATDGSKMLLAGKEPGN